MQQVQVGKKRMKMQYVSLSFQANESTFRPNCQQTPITARGRLS